MPATPVHGITWKATSPTFRSYLARFIRKQRESGPYPGETPARHAWRRAWLSAIFDGVTLEGIEPFESPDQVRELELLLGLLHMDLAEALRETQALVTFLEGYTLPAEAEAAHAP